MAAKPETTFYTSVHKHLPPEVHREKMSNPYRGGTADTWYSGTKADLWIEWKFIVLPKRDDTMIDLCGGNKPSLSGLQQDWLKNRHAEGRDVWVVVGSKEGSVILKNLRWELAFPTDWFRHKMMDRKAIAQAIKEHCL